MYLTSHSNNAGSKIKKKRNPRPRQYRNNLLHWHQFNPTTPATLWTWTTITISLNMKAGTTANLIADKIQCIDPSPVRASVAARVIITISISPMGAISGASSNSPTIRSKSHLINTNSLSLMNLVDPQTMICGDLNTSYSPVALQQFQEALTQNSGRMKVGLTSPESNQRREFSSDTQHPFHYGARGARIHESLLGCRCRRNPAVGSFDD